MVRDTAATEWLAADCSAPYPPATGGVPRKLPFSQSEHSYSFGTTTSACIASNACIASSTCLAPRMGMGARLWKSRVSSVRIQICAVGSLGCQHGASERGSGGAILAAGREGVACGCVAGGPGGGDCGAVGAGPDGVLHGLGPGLRQRRRARALRPQRLRGATGNVGHLGTDREVQGWRAGTRRIHRHVLLGVLGAGIERYRGSRCRCGERGRERERERERARERDTVAVSV